MRGASGFLGVTGVFLFVLSAARGEAPPKLEFDVASVRTRVVERPSGTVPLHQCPTPAECLAEMKSRAPAYGGPGTADPGRMTFQGVSMEALLLTAFAVQSEQISAPDSIQEWLVKNSFIGTKYDIVATVPPGATKEDAKEMLKNLLADRFGFVYHMQTRDLDGYRLTVAKGGPKLKMAASADGPQRVLPRGTRQPFDDQGFPIFQPGYPNILSGMHDRVVHLAGRMVTTEDLLLTLQFWLGASVLGIEDKTGLTGKYDLKLEFADQRPQRLGPAANGAPADAAGDPAPDLFEALEKQLGLKLEKIKVPIDVVVIERLNQQPTDN
jgi:uncharacterized protein (TIGR03435 family)